MLCVCSVSVAEDDETQNFEADEVLADDVFQQIDRTPDITTNQPDIEIYEALGCFARGGEDAESDQSADAGNAEPHHPGSVAADDADSDEVEDAENAENAKNADDD